MKQIKRLKLVGSVLLFVAIAGCASGPVMIDKEASTSAIRAAEEVGASSVPNASLYLQLAKEELEEAKTLAANGKKEQSESMLTRAQADAELAVTISRSDADKTEAAQALERVRKLRLDNQLTQERN